MQMRKFMAVAAILLAVSLSGCDEAPQPGQAGAPFPVDQPFAKLDGGVERMSEHAGKVIVLNVWATWCPPCRREMPSLKRLKGLLDPDKFEVVAVSRDIDPAKARKFVETFNFPFARLHDPKKAITGELMVDVLPTTFIIGPSGKIAAREIGAREWDSVDSISQLKDIEWDAARDAVK